MSTRATTVIKDADRELYLYQHCDGYPTGFADTLNTALSSSNTSSNLCELIAPLGFAYADGVEVDQLPHSHEDAEFKYDIIVLDGKPTITVWIQALDLSMRQDWWSNGFALHDTAWIPAFVGSISEFNEWAPKYDPDAEEYIALRIEASRKVCENATSA